MTTGEAARPIEHVPVLIAGGGPVGLATALEPAHNGVASLVVEPREEVSWLRPRAKTTSAPELTDPRLAGADAECEAVRPPVARAVEESKDGEFHSLDLVLGYAYRGSPLITGTAAGGRFGHRWLDANDSLFDHLGREFTLVGDLARPETEEFVNAAADEGVPLELFHHPPTVVAPVRPDQHVVWNGDATGEARQIPLRAIGHP